VRVSQWKLASLWYFKSDSKDVKRGQINKRSRNAEREGGRAIARSRRIGGVPLTKTVRESFRNMSTGLVFLHMGSCCEGS
jgi:hypothetical protein